MCHPTRLHALRSCWLLETHTVLKQYCYFHAEGPLVFFFCFRETLKKQKRTDGKDMEGHGGQWKDTEGHGGTKAKNKGRRQDKRKTFHKKPDIQETQRGRKKELRSEKSRTRNRRRERKHVRNINEKERVKDRRAQAAFFFCPFKGSPARNGFRFLGSQSAPPRVWEAAVHGMRGEGH